MDVPVECSWASGRASRPNRYVELRSRGEGCGLDKLDHPPLRGLDKLDHPRPVVSTGSTTRPPCGLDKLDHPPCGLDGLDHPSLCGLDKLDHPGALWSRRALPPGRPLGSTGATTRGPRGL